MRLVKFIAVIAVTAVTITSCNQGKKIQKAENSQKVKTPCNADKYSSTKKYFRTTQSGKSPNLGTSKKIALQNAKSELSGNIQSVMKRVTDQYTNQMDIKDKTKFQRRFQEESRTVVKQKLTNVQVVCDETLKTDDDSYQRFVGIEMNKEDFLNGFEDRISNDEELKLKYNEKKFEETFNKEMKKMEEEQP